MKDILNIYQTCFENLINIYSKDDFYNEIKKAKISFAQNWGEIIENDPNYEARLQQFFDWYILERELEKIKEAPINHFIASTNFSDDYDEEKEIYLSMAKSIHSIFQVTKIKKNILVLSNLLDKKNYKIQNCDFQIIFDTDSVLEGRVIVTKKGSILSKGFCLHPQGGASYIKKQMAPIKKTKGSVKEKKILLYNLMKKLIKMYNLHLVYKHVKIEKVYSSEPLFSGVNMGKKCQRRIS